jgi:hypothetical protein
MMLKEHTAIDIEQEAGHGFGLYNSIIRDFTWRQITVTVKDKQTKKPKTILDNVAGRVEAGEYDPVLWAAL